MSDRLHTLLLCVGLSAACREPLFVASGPLGEAEMIVAVVVRDGEVILDRSRILFPNLGRNEEPGLSLNDDELLALLAFDEVALRRGLLAPVELDPKRISLHAASGIDCGRRGNEVAVESDGLSRMRQAMGRFEPTLHVVDPLIEGVRAPEEGEIDSLDRLELEVPSNAEACRERLRPELEPLGRNLSLGDGWFESQTGLSGAYLEGSVDLQVTGGGRLFLTTQHVILALRRAERFDQAQDDFLRVNGLGLPTSLEGESWNLARSLVEVDRSPGTFRFFVLARRAFDAMQTGAALLELPWDGASFGEPRVRMLWEERGPTHLERDAAGALVLVGKDGAWGLAMNLDAEVVTGRLVHADIEALAVTRNSDAPHLLAINGGFLGHGDLRSPGELTIRQMRTEASANVLTSTVHQGETWIYSGWKNGEILRSRLATEATLEPTGLGLPRRLSACAQEYDACGRGVALERPFGVAIVAGPADEPLLAATFEECSSVIVHELETGCTTSVEFPVMTSGEGRALHLRQSNGRLWVLEPGSFADVYELHIARGP